MLTMGRLDFPMISHRESGLHIEKVCYTQMAIHSIAKAETSHHVGRLLV